MAIPVIADDYVDRAFGTGVEAFGIEHRSLVVVAQEDEFALHDEVDALAVLGVHLGLVERARTGVRRGGLLGRLPRRQQRLAILGSF